MAAAAAVSRIDVISHPLPRTPRLAGRGEPEDRDGDADGRVDAADAVQQPQVRERLAVARVAVRVA